MLVGGIAYLYAFDGKKCTAVYDINPLSPYSYVKKIRADRDGRIWVACYDALNRYNLCVFTPDSKMARKSSSKKIYEENQAVDTGVDDGVLQSSA
jgi:ligand-binding sensor domain-containing protein